jgi:hypothetical protein
MHKAKRSFVCLLSLLFISSFLSAASQESKREKSKPVTLDDYDLVARGKMSQNRPLRPVQIARMDNNGEILFACVEAKTIEQLESIGITFRESQLELLVDWNLLEHNRKNKTYKTTIHVYGTLKSSAIRQQVRNAVAQLVTTLDDDLRSLGSHLAKIGREKSMYAILYAYVLHSYAMNQLGKEINQKPQLSEKNPFWNGYAWAIYPTQKYPTGVTFLPNEGNQFYFVSAAGVPRFDFQQMMAFVKDAAPDTQVDDPELRKSLSAYGICDNEGTLAIPVFENEWYEKLEKMAKTVYATTIELVDADEMKDILGMETQAQAAMFLHYEMRYAFLNHVLENGIIEAPADFKNSGNNSSANMRNLVFWIKTEKSN